MNKGREEVEKNKDGERKEGIMEECAEARKKVRKGRWKVVRWK